MNTILRIFVVAVLLLFTSGTLSSAADARPHKGQKAHRSTLGQHKKAGNKASAKVQRNGRRHAAVAVKSGRPLPGKEDRLGRVQPRREGKQLARHRGGVAPAGLAHAGRKQGKHGRKAHVANHRRPLRGVGPVAMVAAPPRAEAPAISLAGQTEQALRRRLSARSAIVMDARSGQLLYAQAPDLPGQPASTLKILTALISLESLDSDELVPASQRAAAMPKSKVYLRPGAHYPADDLINAALMASANDACVALAEKIGGSEPGFAKLMTAKARSLGANTTVCKNASGLTASGQQSTARDLATMFAIAMRNKEFAAKLARTEVTTQEGKILRSHNRALWQVDGAQGGKTGYTDLARHTYVGKFSRPEGELVVALMGSNRMWPDIANLVKYGFAEKSRQNYKTAAAVAAPVKLAENRPLLAEGGKLTR